MNEMRDVFHQVKQATRRCHENTLPSSKRSINILSCALNCTRALPALDSVRFCQMLYISLAFLVRDLALPASSFGMLITKILGRNSHSKSKDRGLSCQRSELKGKQHGIFGLKKASRVAVENRRHDVKCHIEVQDLCLILINASFAQELQDFFRR